MNNQLGITKYKDLMNKELLTDMKNNVKELVLRYNMLAAEESVNNRESELFEKYTSQYSDDMDTLSLIRQYAQNLVDLCNQANFLISKRSIMKHVYEWDTRE